MGENIQREWNDEPFRHELWNALQVRKEDHNRGVTMLTDLAARGSTLAMMYLGHAAVSISDCDEEAQGEEWLGRSSRGGSIEGRFQLALHYLRKARYAKGEDELRFLAKAGYSPAINVLAHFLYKGTFGARHISDAVRYFEVAKEHGHFLAAGRLAWIYRNEGYGFRMWAPAQWHCVKRIPALLWYSWRYPNSDKLRNAI